MPLSQCREQNSLSHELSPGSARTRSEITILSESLRPVLLCSCKQQWQSLISYANDTWHLESSDTEAVNKKPSTARLSVCLVPTVGVTREGLRGVQGGSSHQLTKKPITNTNCCFHPLQAPRTPIMLMSGKKKPNPSAGF